MFWIFEYWADLYRQFKEWLKPTPIVIPTPIELPPGLLFNWHRDYGPLWEPGSTAFWLEPEPGDLPAGVWPLPCIKSSPPASGSGLSGTVHHFYDEDGKVILSYFDGSTTFTPGRYITLSTN